MATQVSELSVDELKILIREVVRATIEDMFRDPDDGLELRADIAEHLRRSIDGVKSGDQTLDAETVAAQLGLKW